MLHLSLTLPFMEVSGQILALAAFYQGKKPWYPLNINLGGPQNQHGWFGRTEYLLPLTGFESLTTQLATSHNIDYTMLAPFK